MPPTDRPTIQIALRHSSAGAMLTFHVPRSLKKRFVDGMKAGEVGGEDLASILELNVGTARIATGQSAGTDADAEHFRIPIHQIAVNYTD